MGDNSQGIPLVSNEGFIRSGQSSTNGCRVE